MFRISDGGKRTCEIRLRLDVEVIMTEKEVGRSFAAKNARCRMGQGFRSNRREARPGTFEQVQR